MDSIWSQQDGYEGMFQYAIHGGEAIGIARGVPHIDFLSVNCHDAIRITGGVALVYLSSAQGIETI